MANKHGFLLKKAVICLILIVLCSFTALAYTGAFAVFPALIGGPDHNTVENFPVDTTVENPQTIEAGLYFVERIIIETDPGQQFHLLIEETPAKNGEPATFSFTVPQKVNDDLVQATVYFWGPDVDILTVIHEHNNAPPQTIIPVKTDPVEYDEDGRVLWVFTTTSFSQFHIINENSEKADDSKSMIPILCYAAFLAVLSASACILFRKGK